MKLKELTDQEKEMITIMVELEVKRHLAAAITVKYLNNVKMKEEFLNYLKNTNFEDLTDEELEDNIIDKVTEIMEQN